MRRVYAARLPWAAWCEVEAIPGWRWPSRLSAQTLRAMRLGIWWQHFEQTKGPRPPSRHDFPSVIRARDVDLVRRAYAAGRLPVVLIELFDRCQTWTWTGRRATIRTSAPPTARVLRAAVESVRERLASTCRSDVARDDRSDAALNIRWLRRLAWRGALPAEVRHQLSALDGWAWSQRQAVRQSRDRDIAMALGHFAQEFGHCRVPADYCSVDGFPLGAQLARFAVRLAASRVAPSVARTVERLPGADVLRGERVPDSATNATDGTATRADSPHALIADVRRLVVRYGHAAFPATMEVGGERVGESITTLRAMRDVLSPDLLSALERLRGWCWSAQEAIVWLRVERAAQQLADFVAVTGHPQVPAQHVTASGYPLGTRVRHIARQFTAGKLGAEHAALFAEIPGWSVAAMRQGPPRAGVAQVQAPTSAVPIPLGFTILSP
ncbi:MAG: helicase associated domain-containing protein [Gemmatimonadaceae bacterium]|nr:helicase associated domain-containing protein [Gemmatimonadaceae bacterium]